MSFNLSITPDANAIEKCKKNFNASIANNLKTATPKD